MVFVGWETETLLSPMLSYKYISSPNFDMFEEQEHSPQSPGYNTPIKAQDERSLPPTAHSIELNRISISLDIGCLQNFHSYPSVMTIIHE